MNQLKNVSVFDISNHIQDHGVNELKKDEKKKENNTIESISNKVKEYFKDIYSDDKTNSSEATKRQELEHRAVLGDKDAELILVQDIETYLRENNLLGIKYPTFYNSLAEAIFHEIYRFGVVHKWASFPESASAKIQGKEIWFKIKGEFVKQKEEFKNEEFVYEIIRALEMANPGLKVNASNPQAEVEMKDGTRVTIIRPPRALKPTIVFRRFIVRNFSFLEQANRGTIAHEDINFFDNLAKLYLNTIIAGHVESGKSTMLKTFYGAREPEKVAVLVESSPETYLKRDFPDRLVHDFYSLDTSVETIFRAILRVDHDYMIVQEVRGVEAEGAIAATQRGRSGLLMTYHITDPANTATQLAQHITDEFPNRREANEIRRISSQLDIGITMSNFPGNEKRVTSIYEICYDSKEDRAWINYLMRYKPDTDSWIYNSNVSPGLLEKMRKVSRSRTDSFLNHLSNRSFEHPMEDINIDEINVKG